MSSRIQMMRKARINSASVFAQILKMNNKFTTPLYCCYEGEDFKYYGVRVEHLKSKQHEKVISMRCGGKKEVIRLYELISKENSLTNRDILYFVDLDFDNSINSTLPTIYETPVYSIENFYTSKCAFEKILNAELKIEEANPLFSYCIEKFIERQIEFHEGVKYLNAWVYCQRQKETDKLNLNNFKLSDIIENLSIDLFSFKEYNKSTLKGLLPNAMDIEDVEIEQAIELLSVNPREKFRGKFEIEFLYEFVTLLKESINKKVLPFDKCKKVGFNVSKANILSEFSQYAGV